MAIPDSVRADLLRLRDQFDAAAREFPYYRPVLRLTPGYALRGEFVGRSGPIVAEHQLGIVSRDDVGPNDLGPFPGDYFLHPLNELGKLRFATDGAGKKQLEREHQAEVRFAGLCADVKPILERAGVVFVAWEDANVGGQVLHWAYGSPANLGDSCEWEIAMSAFDRVANTISSFLAANTVDPRDNLGVSVHDICWLHDPDDKACANLVKRFNDSKKITATKLGKDTRDGRAALYRLSELLENFAEFLGLDSIEKIELRKQLAPHLRQPKAS
jgi:hypothetical protein